MEGREAEEATIVMQLRIEVTAKKPADELPASATGVTMCAPNFVRYVECRTIRREMCGQRPCRVELFGEHERTREIRPQRVPIGTTNRSKTNVRERYGAVVAEHDVFGVEAAGRADTGSRAFFGEKSEHFEHRTKDGGRRIDVEGARGLECIREGRTERVRPDDVRDVAVHAGTDDGYQVPMTQADDMRDLAEKRHFTGVLGRDQMAPLERHDLLELFGDRDVDLTERGGTNASAESVWTHATGIECRLVDSVAAWCPIHPEIIARVVDRRTSVLCTP